MTGAYLSHAIGAIPGRKVLAQLFESSTAATDWTLAVAAEQYTATPPTDRKWVIERVCVDMADGAALATDQFAASGGALATGVLFRWRHNPAGAGVATYIDLLDGLAITVNAHFTRAGFEFEEYTTGGGHKTARWCLDFGKACGTPVVLDGSAAVGSFLEFDVQDALGALGINAIRATAHGWEI